jgi:hypothetical protein
MVTAATAAATPSERLARGTAARAVVEREDHAGWAPWTERPDPVALLEQQAAGRLPELAPIRYGRMLSSPFAFFRGAAAIMAFDLAGTPSTGLEVQLCGDAHISNFGASASPERGLWFGLRDFDETLPGPWEWDVKRLVASVEVAARERGLHPAERRAAVLATARGYRTAMLELAARTNLEAWYAKLGEAEIPTLLGAAGDGMRAPARIDGRPRIAADPPTIVPIEELLPRERADALEDTIRTLLRRYRSSVKSDRRRLLDGYRYAHLARAVVGVGSVGLRAWIVLLCGRDDADPLFLQIQEAEASVLERYAGMSRHNHHGQRVVEGQWLMQPAGDTLLGWLRTTGIDGQPRDFYVRRLWDCATTVPPADLARYGRMCGWTLAHAHARSGDRLAIAGYVGDGDELDEALAAFAAAYADQTERDYAALAEAARSGRVIVETDV